MTTPRQINPIAASNAPRCGLTAEWTMAWLVLLAIAMSILSSALGHADAEGKAKNGVRRAASQLERKVVKGLGAPAVRTAWVRVG